MMIIMMMIIQHRTRVVITRSKVVDKQAMVVITLIETRVLTRKWVNNVRMMVVTATEHSTQITTQDS